MPPLFRPFLLILCAVLLGLPPSALRGAPGDLDATFNFNLSSNNSVNSIAVQPDGKLILGGRFSRLGSTARQNLARLNADNTLDATFAPSVDNGPGTIIVQTDGKIFLGGNFTTVNGTTRNYVARLNADGSLDPGFNPNLPSGTYNGVYTAAPLADGKILLGGLFTNPAAAKGGNLARLNADGSLDTTFSLTADQAVYALAVQPDGKILIGGSFTALGDTLQGHLSYLARLNTDGTLDNEFSPSVTGAVVSIALQADGKILIGGYFAAVGGVSRNYVARLTATGSLDTSFNPILKDTASVFVQADGKILLAGLFSAVNGATHNALARLNADGSNDLSFNPTTANTDVSDSVSAVALRADGKIVIGGYFSSVNNTPRINFAQLFNDRPAQKIVGTGTTGSYTVQLLRGGALPEAQQVTFEASANNGATWTAPVAATRITGGWQATIALPSASGLVRARARVPGAGGNASSGVMEMVAAYPTPNLGVEQPVGSALVNGGAVDFGELPLGVGTSSITKMFTVRNSGAANLVINGLTLDGTNSGEFLVNTSGLNTVLSSGASTTFGITFAPGGSTSGIRSAALHLASNANGTYNPFDLPLTGLGLSATTSTGNDGLNDHAKYQLSALGFDWHLGQSALVQALYGGASTAGLYTTAQVQALNVGTPLIQRNAGTGLFTLTIAVQQSADLQTFSPLSLSTGAISINSAGALLFQFSSPTGAAFYRLQSQ